MPQWWNFMRIFRMQPKKVVVHESNPCIYYILHPLPKTPPHKIMPLNPSIYEVHPFKATPLYLACLNSEVSHHSPIFSPLLTNLRRQQPRIGCHLVGCTWGPMASRCSHCPVCNSHGRRDSGCACRPQPPTRIPSGGNLPRPVEPAIKDCHFRTCS